MKKLAAFLLALVAFVFGSTALAQTHWIEDPQSGCRVQNTNPVPDESIRWSGQCNNGYAEGRGTLQWFIKGEPVSRTEGEWREGRLNGRALGINADGGRYEGEFRDGRPHGRGITTFPNGNRLDGTYRDGKANGRGVLSFANGSKLDAEFVNDEAVKGVWVYPNGNRYEGTLKNWHAEGRGTKLQTDGGYYEGDFVESRLEGQGVMNFPNGNRYEGAWRNSMPNGPGTYHSKQGPIHVFRGLWVDGCLSPGNSDNGRWATVNKSAAACGFR